MKEIANFVKPACQSILLWGTEKNTLKKKQKIKRPKNKTTARMEFIIFSLITGFSFSLAFFFRQQAGKFLSPQAALTIEVAIELALILLILFIFTKSPVKSLFDGPKGVMFAVLSGLAVTAGVFFNFLSLKAGFLSKVAAITPTSQIIFGILLGILLVGESFTVRQVIGTIIAISGIILVIFK